MSNPWHNRRPGKARGAPAPAASPKEPLRAPRAMALLGEPPAMSQIAAATYPLHIDEKLLLDAGCPQGAQHNPSVAVVGGELRAVVRVLSLGRTYNFLGRIDARLELADARYVRDKTAPVEHRPRNGYEDLRLFEHRGQLWGVATILPDKLAQITLVRFDGVGDIIQSNPQPSTVHEKNWMPFVSDGVLWLVYNTNPVCMLQWNHATSLAEGERTKIDGGRVRGGSQLVSYGQGSIAVVHEVYQSSRHGVVYAHRFARFDRFMRNVVLGAPFYFERLGIEFCAGLARHADKWVLSYGVSDSQARIALVTDNTVRGMVGA